MVLLTRLDGREVVVNSDLIVTVEATPDTVVTLTTGDRLMVKERVSDIVDRAVAFRHRVLQGPGFQVLSNLPAFAERSAPVAAIEGQVSPPSADVPQGTSNVSRSG